MSQVAYISPYIRELTTQDVSVQEQLLLLTKNEERFRKNVFLMEPSALEALANVLILKLQGKDLTELDLSWLEVGRIVGLIEMNYQLLYNNAHRLELLMKILTLLLLKHEWTDEGILNATIEHFVAVFQKDYLNMPLFYDVLRTMMRVALEKEWQQKAYSKLDITVLAESLHKESVKLRDKALGVLRLLFNFRSHAPHIVKWWASVMLENKRISQKHKSFMLCHLVQIATERKDQVDPFMNIVESVDIWQIICENCANVEQLVRKETISTIKNIMAFLKAHSDRKINNDLFRWVPDDAEEITKAWQCFITILEALPESQTHLIEPVLPLVEKLDYLAPEWKNVALQLILRHDNSVVSSWAIDYMLHKSNFVAAREQLEFILLESLNKTTLFQDFTTMKQLLKEYYSSNDAYRFLLTRFRDVKWGAVPFACFLELIDELLYEVAVPQLDEVLKDLVEQCKSINVLNLRQLVALRLTNMLLQLAMRGDMFTMVPFSRILLHLEALVKITKINLSEMDLWASVEQFIDEETVRQLVDEMGPYDMFIMRDVFEALVKYKHREVAERLIRSMIDTKLLSAVRILQQSEQLFLKAEIEFEINILLKKIDGHNLESLKALEVLTALAQTPHFVKQLPGTVQKILHLLPARLDWLNYDACSMGCTIRMIQIASNQGGMKTVKRFLDVFSLDNSFQRGLAVGSDLSHRVDSYTVLGEIYLQMLKWEAFDTLTNDRIFLDFSKLIELGGVHVLFKAIEAITFLLENKLVNPYTTVESTSVSGVINRCYKDILMVHRRTEHFMKLVKNFVHMLFAPMKSYNSQNEDQNRWLKEAVSEYVKMIMEQATAIAGLANILFEKVLTLPVELLLDWNSFGKLLLSGFILGDGQKREQRIEDETCMASRYYHTSLFKPPTQFQADTRVRIMCAIFLHRLAETTHPDATLLLLKVEQMIIEEFQKISKLKSRYYKNSVTHRHKLRLLQAFCVICKLTGTQPYPLLPILLHETNEPNINYLIELILADSSIDTLTIINSLRLDKVKVSGIHSVFVILWLRCCKTNSFEVEYINFLLPWTMAQNFSTRLFAQVTISKLIEKFYVQLNKLDSCPFANVYAAINSYVKAGNVEKNLEKVLKDFRFNTMFDYENLLTLENVFNNIPRVSNMSPEDVASTSLLTECTDALQLTEVNLGEAIDPDELPIEDRKEHLMLSPGHGGSDHVQKKIVPLKSIEPSEEMYEDIPESVRLRKMKNDEGLILIASLVDRAPNLGGLARSAEVFGIHQYVVNSLKEVENKEFQALSMTAEKWLNLAELKYFQIPEYLLEMKAKGYTIIGAEQTTGSLPIHTIRFPKYCVVVLGHEKEGIPAHIISYLDITVEIPQFGVVRSLNVHVTGAICMWEYVRSNFLGR
ncbi:uncharacterized protein LOC129769687 [Toxorhynchites rutilus septentrionalis]|uniref:uncharacterized protein LOC129769687 n=1 Tax=Toxorhynchites rutilus septentrionalis TaxID=329112 RepID=UPI00247A3810|nr:uncharacterized protein LOC129769687 [Toxorhynchites rutilus septentrionalis]